MWRATAVALFLSRLSRSRRTAWSSWPASISSGRSGSSGRGGRRSADPPSARRSPENPPSPPRRRGGPSDRRSSRPPEPPSGRRGFPERPAPSGRPPVRPRGPSGRPDPSPRKGRRSLLSSDTGVPFGRAWCSNEIRKSPSYRQWHRNARRLSKRKKGTHLGGSPFLRSLPGIWNQVERTRYGFPNCVATPSENKTESGCRSATPGSPAASMRRSEQ